MYPNGSASVNNTVDTCVFEGSLDMSNCLICGQSTELYLNGVPICVRCEDHRDELRKALTPGSSVSRIEAIMEKWSIVPFAAQLNVPRNQAGFRGL
jgi:hypothetical protein